MDANPGIDEGGVQYTYLGGLGACCQWIWVGLQSRLGPFTLEVNLGLVKGLRL